MMWSRVLLYNLNFEGNCYSQNILRSSFFETFLAFIQQIQFICGRNGDREPLVYSLQICMADMDHFPEVIIWNTVGDAWRSESDTAVLARADSGKETKTRLEDHTFMHII